MWNVSADSIFRIAILQCSLISMREIEAHVGRDLLRQQPEQLRGELTRVRHMYLDAIGEAASLIIPDIERACTVCDHTLRFEQFVGQDVVVSVCISPSFVDQVYREIESYRPTQWGS
jgi:hypothetical protein